jgi:hypothetical protein
LRFAKISHFGYGMSKNTNYKISKQKGIAALIILSVYQQKMQLKDRFEVNKKSNTVTL